MNEKIWTEIKDDIMGQDIRHGSCEVKLTFHDGRIVVYELTTHYRRNIHVPRDRHSQKKEADND